MTGKFVSILDQMRSVWDEVACRAAAPEDAASWLETGRAVVRAHLQRELDRLAAERGLDSLTVLDLGCGNGAVVAALAEICGAVHGLDISPEALRRAGSLLNGNDRVQLHLGDGMTLRSVRRTEFDLVFSRDTLSHLPDRGLLVYLLRQVGQRLAPGGLFKFQLDAATCAQTELPELLEPAGLQLEESAVDEDSLWVWSRAAR